MPIAALILAAGDSSRLGRPKQLVAVGGEPLLRRTARVALDAGFAPLLVVLGADLETCRAALDGLPVTVLENQSWREGMSASLRIGVAALGLDTDAVLLLVCDQTRLSSVALEELQALFHSSGAMIAAARYAGRLGVPAIFRRALFPELAQVTGDRGARSVLEARRDQAAVLDLPEAAFDVDTPADLDLL